MDQTSDTNKTDFPKKSRKRKHESRNYLEALYVFSL